MKIEELLMCIELPKRYYDKNFDIREKYEIEAAAFLENVKLIDGAEFDGKTAIIQESFVDMIPVIENVIHKILDVYKYYEEANPKDAQIKFDELMMDLIDTIFIVTIDDWVTLKKSKERLNTRIRVTAGNSFYRVRRVNGKRTDIESNPDELFHVPLSKRASVNNERFSLAGFPSLYLASALPLAWQESEYPQKCYFSQYQYLKLNGEERHYNDELQFLALYSPAEIYGWGVAIKNSHFDLWLEVIARYLKMYPLVLACSFVNQNGKGSFKQEYIISQMLMQWVQRNQKSVQGIAYFTCADSKMIPRGNCAYNVAIPALAPYDEKKYSQKLREVFNWTKPTYYEMPLLNPEMNRSDKARLHNYISSLAKIQRYWLPINLREYLYEIERVCTCLYQLMTSDSNTDPKIIIHTLELVDACFNHIRSQSRDKILEQENEDGIPIQKEEYRIKAEEIKGIIDEFFNENRKTNGIGFIIKKYKDTVWNDYHSESFISIEYKERDDISELEQWLHNNHLIYRKKCISGEESDCKTPVVSRINSLSIYDDEEREYCDYKKEGFVLAVDGNSLLG